MIVNKGKGIQDLAGRGLLLFLAGALLTVPFSKTVYAERIYGVPVSEVEEDSPQDSPAQAVGITIGGDEETCQITLGETPDEEETVLAVELDSDNALEINGIENTTIQWNFGTDYAGYYGTGYSDVSVSGDALVWRIYQYLLQEGFSTASACGILGNIQRESGFKPTIGSLSGVYGLYQVKGGCLETILDYCEARGLSYKDGMAQTEAMIRGLAPEMFETFTGRHEVYDWSRKKAVDDGSNHFGEAGYCWWYDAMTLEEYKQIDDPEYAVEVWRRIVERNTGSAKDIAKRKNFARKFYRQYATLNQDASDIIWVGAQYIGNPYVWGGNSLTKGIDCSHFVCKILTMTGHYDGGYRTSKALRTAGTEVASLAEAMPGDVLCYKGHVAFYAGENTILHAAGKKRGIVMDHNVDIQKFHKGLLTIRRFR